MLLKNLMEDKQLNLNQPFLSIRRVSPTVASRKDETKKTEYSLPTVTHPPHYKSELKSGPVRNPGVVPFLWEQSPGKPKYESKRQIRATEKPPIAPRLPPGRKLKDNHYSYKAHESQNDVSKSEIGNAQHYTPSYMNFDEKVKKSESIDDKERRESEDVDEVYMDAPNKLSRTESFFVNCSVSGLSGLDEPEAKPSGTPLTDPQARDFMIDRFLPAAKAMASEKTVETPHYDPRKQRAVQEQPKQLKKVVNEDKRPQLRYGPSFALRYSQFHDNYEGKEEEESDDDSCYDGNLPYKVCGLLPRFCLKSSFCLMNPVPGMSARTRVPMSPASRTQTRSSSTTSCSGSENEVSIPAYANDDAARLGLQKDTTDHFQELFDYQNKIGEADSAAPLVEKTLHVDIVHKVESPIMKSPSPKAEKPFNLHDEDIDILEKITQQKPSVDSSPSYFAKPVDGNGGEMMASGQSQDRYQDAVASVKPKDDVKQSTRKQTVRKEKLENLCVAHSKLPTPPPLPKSPSDSWLCRTLPSLSTKNASSRSYVGTGISPNNQSCKPLSTDPKWETIVKTTKGHQQHLRYTEEMIALTPIPEAQ